MTTLSNFSLPNQANGGARNADYDVRYATALKLFSGEVFTAFNNASIFKGLVRSYDLRGGKSKQFMFTGKLSAGYHTPGTPIVGDAGIKANEKTLVMDDLLVSSQFVYSLDEIFSQYSTRAEVSKQIGEALATHYDERIARVLAKASAEASPVTGEPGGFHVNIGAGNTNDAQAIVDGFFEAAAVLDERSAPQEGRVAVLSPRQYYSLISSVDTNILNREIGNSQGDMNSGKGLYSIAGIRILKSNNLAGLYGQDLSSAAVTGENNDYQVDASALAGLIFHREAAGCIQSVAPTIQTTSGDFNVQYQGDLIVGKLAMGCGSLRTSVAGSFQAA
ncbi:major head protein [Synechococcus phage Syn5]|uniref:Major capsid protein n=1 Tax=Synechococcus phage Syn5 TaxID=2914003 RepID=A4ZRC0_9CAUD|nr:major head protein [Synechococcus phage Syn5]4BML_A Chain A, MAJOR CAPSID PROTEIN [Voetvirus syn5]4BML_B Chain B, MAJOR CAPSID PROTEIN [Voetvirus syn5]4BML_C Chain C, MAJOR CAPSID PROTEIN [Voetvirus syn5]4BML_D Chain D, MAJOR CAPSID PROTEIN [Voetvirus syn5]4BML_E Chain E, MAJOR CAPSID PROTEIN [Voetvirus syn5]4BML_F Chain F, MAJOR CAPSID PROTEIN [Voetvirus syn5]4BML_G Chain G, MAJOR CAPSID PROTEIN [Voetvirus syn5]ABP87946.1 major capsid protein [Synechococcus phage Syn5]